MGELEALISLYVMIFLGIVLGMLGEAGLLDKM